MLNDYGDVLTVNDIYKILPLGKNSVYELLNSGKIKVIRINKKILVLKEDLINFLKAA